MKQVVNYRNKRKRYIRRPKGDSVNKAGRGGKLKHSSKRMEQEKIIFENIFGRIYVQYAYRQTIYL